MAFNVKTEKIKKPNIKQQPKNELAIQDPVSNMPSSATPYNENNLLDRKNILKNLEKKRRLKMNLLLAFIAIIFAASWLPLNIFNILSDSKNSIKADHTFYATNAICILFAMSSAVSNPFLYGFLNENFKREYVKLFRKILSKLFCFSNHHKQGKDDVNNEIILKYNENRLKISDIRAQKNTNESSLLRYDIEKV